MLSAFQGEVYGETMVFSESVTIGDYVINSTDTLIIEDGVTLTLNGTLTNNGTIENYGMVRGSNDLTDYIDFDNYGVIQNQGDLSAYSTRLNNYETLNNEEGGTIGVSVIGSMNNYGLLNNDGKLSLTTYAAVNDGTINNNGEITVGRGFGLLGGHGFFMNSESGVINNFENSELILYPSAKPTIQSFHNVGVINIEKSKIENHRQIINDGTINNNGEITNHKDVEFGLGDISDAQIVNNNMLNIFCNGFFNDESSVIGNEIIEVCEPPIIIVNDLIILEATSSTGSNELFSVSVTDDIDSNLIPNCTHNSGDLFPLNQNTIVTCTAIDSDGNEAEKTFTVQVHDTTPPIIPDVKTIEKTSPDGDSIKNDYVEPSAHDIVDGEVQSYCNPAPNSFFNIGANEVTCNAKDDAGNSAVPIEFFIVVRDGKFSDLDSDGIPDGKDLCPQAAETLNGFEDSDGCPDKMTPPIVSEEDPPITCGNGETLVDEKCLVMTKEPDVDSPILTGPQKITKEPQSKNGAEVEFDVTATDDFGVVKGPICEPSSGTLFPANQNTTVTCEAFDAAGNMGKWKFDIIVLPFVDDVVTETELIYEPEPTPEPELEKQCGSGTKLVNGICVVIKNTGSSMWWEDPTILLGIIGVIITAVIAVTGIIRLKKH